MPVLHAVAIVFLLAMPVLQLVIIAFLWAVSCAKVELLEAERIDSSQIL